MAYFLTKTCFIHVPKCGGRWIKRHLVSTATITDVEYKGTLGLKNKEHYAPTWKELGDKKPFAFLRHPITWLASLHNHRVRKRKNWQKQIPLEKIGHHDWHQFVKNVIAYPNWIYEYYAMHVGQYGNKITIGKMENIEEELIQILKTLDEPIKSEQLKHKGKEMHRSKFAGTNSRLNSLSQKEIDALYNSQIKAFETYKYTKEWK